MFAGVPIQLGDEEYIVPALSLSQVKSLRTKFVAMEQLRGQAQSIADEKFIELLDIAVPIIHAALARNYPDLSQESLYNLLDLDTMNQCVEAVLSVSGLKRVRQGERTPVSAPLAMPAAASTTTSSGSTSTDSSLPAPVGVSSTSTP